MPITVPTPQFITRRAKIYGDRTLRMILVKPPPHILPIIFGIRPLPRSNTLPGDIRKRTHTFRHRRKNQHLRSIISCRTDIRGRGAEPACVDGGLDFLAVAVAGKVLAEGCVGFGAALG